MNDHGASGTLKKRAREEALKLRAQRKKEKRAQRRRDKKAPEGPTVLAVRQE
jgi:hypothetical protein